MDNVGNFFPDSNTDITGERKIGCFSWCNIFNELDMKNLVDRWRKYTAKSDG